MVTAHYSTIPIRWEVEEEELYDDTDICLIIGHKSKFDVLILPIFEADVNVTHTKIKYICG